MLQHTAAMACPRTHRDMKLGPSVSHEAHMYTEEAGIEMEAREERERGRERGLRLPPYAKARELALFQLFESDPTSTGKSKAQYADAIASARRRLREVSSSSGADSTDAQAVRVILAGILLAAAGAVDAEDVYPGMYREAHAISLQVSIRQHT
jgi:hypothetical protein